MAKIYLDPFQHVIRFLDVAVITKRRNPVRRLLQRSNSAIKIDERSTVPRNNPAVKFFSLGQKPRLARLKRCTDGCYRRILVVFLIGSIDGGENRLKAVVVLLWDRIELVVVTLGALDGE